jgi:hypothetical protein
MQIVQHIGANCTDGDRLVRGLLKNVDHLASRGVAVPRPASYRRLLRDTIHGLAGQVPAADTRDILLDAILDDFVPDRLVLSNPDFICVPPRIFEGGMFYAQAVPKVRGLRRLFPKDDLELHLALRDPATFLPAAFGETTLASFDAFMNGVDPQHLRWSELIARIQGAVPRVPITVWCNEDTPLIWGQVMRGLIGTNPFAPIDGEYDLLSTIMSVEGMQRFLTYLQIHPPQSEAQKHRIITAFLDRYAIADELEEEIDLPGWTEDSIDWLTDIYEEDVHKISQMPGVTFLSP